MGFAINVAARDTNDRHRGKDRPSPQAVIEARRVAKLAAALDPLALAFGDPLPGRSALDKMKGNT